MCADFIRDRTSPSRGILTGSTRPASSIGEELAQAYAAKVRKHAGRGSLPVEDHEITLEVYAERWLKRVEALAGYIKKDIRYHLDKHLLPALGHLKLRAIRRAHVRTLWAEKAGAGYANNTIRLFLGETGPASFVGRARRP